MQTQRENLVNFVENSGDIVWRSKPIKSLSEFLWNDPGIKSDMAT